MWCTINIININININFNVLKSALEIVVHDVLLGAKIFFFYVFATKFNHTRAIHQKTTTYSDGRADALRSVVL